ncbi:MAG: hypothetical protein DMG15_10185 [Acidobacteria bacterium]|nr:MAG: hypothetical protein DMG15_10185 [Acidobacteriota bacterium]
MGTLQEAGKDQLRSRHADLNNAAQTELQRPSVAFQVFTKDGIGRMKEKRNAELFDASVKGRKPLGVDACIPADAAGNIGSISTSSGRTR